ncbi:hypothetical protein [Herbihabitans rhizosphaerae]|nr:hypothetical protein [Herbihabitans rhizosphaerae]
MWVVDRHDPNLEHRRETEDGVPRVIETHAGPIPVGSCGGWLADKVQASAGKPAQVLAMPGHRRSCRGDCLMNSPESWIREYSNAPNVDLSDIAELDSCRLAALYRAEQGRLRLHGDLIFCAGRACPDQVVLAAHNLIREGLLCYAPHPEDTAVRIEPTEAGRAELKRLRQEARERMCRAVEKERSLWMQWSVVAIVAVFFVTKLVCHVRDRPSPHGTDAEQRTRSKQ